MGYPYMAYPRKTLKAPKDWGPYEDDDGPRLNTSEYPQVWFSIDPPRRAQLIRLAKENGTTVTELMRSVVAELLEELGAPNGPSEEVVDD